MAAAQGDHGRQGLGLDGLGCLPGAEGGGYSLGVRVGTGNWDVGFGVGIRNLGLEMGRFLGKKPVMRVLAAASCFSHWTLMFPGEGARPKEDYAMSLATPEASSASGQLKSLQWLSLWSLKLF